MVNAWIKAPGVAWLGQFFLPLGPLLGDQRALLASVVACQVTSLAMIFASASRLGTGRDAAVTGALVLASSPLFVWSTHEYLAEALQVVTVAWSLRSLALAGRSHNPIAIAAQLPGLAAVAMLSKISSPLYVALPIAATGALLVRRAPPVPRATRALAPAPGAVIAALGSITAVLGAAFWYGRNFDAALEHARIAREDSGLYGTERGFGAELLEWIDRMTDATFLPLVAVGIGLLVVSALGYKLFRGGHSCGSSRASPRRGSLCGSACSRHPRLRDAAERGRAVPASGRTVRRPRGFARRVTRPAVPRGGCDRAAVRRVALRDASGVRNRPCRTAELLSPRGATPRCEAADSAGSAGRFRPVPRRALVGSWSSAPSIPGSTPTPSR